MAANYEDNVPLTDDARNQEMSGSLQDQLLKAGRVTEDQLRDARERPKSSRGNDRRTGSNGKNKRRGKGGKGPQQQQQQQAARPKRQAGKPAPAPKGGDTLSPEERALRNRVHTMIADATVEREEGEVAYHFVKGSRIKRLYVTEAQRLRLADGELAVAAMKGRHYLIPMSTAKDVKALIPEYFIAMGNSQDPVDENAEVDDEYADYQVPDDLTW